MNNHLNKNYCFFNCLVAIYYYRDKCLNLKVWLHGFLYKYNKCYNNYASAGPKSKTPIWLEQIIIALITNPHA